MLSSEFRHSEWAQLGIPAGESSSQHLPSSEQEVCVDLMALLSGEAQLMF